MPITLKDAGVKREQLPDIAKTAQGDGSLIFNRAEADFQDIVGILEAAY
jgi:alcohol dehydrogenase class IV